MERKTSPRHLWPRFFGLSGLRMKILKELVPGQELEEVTFLRRYKRFLVDVVRKNGQTLTVHNPNTGSMKSCLRERARAVISWKTEAQIKKSGAKLPATLELLHSGRGWIGVNTMRTNGIVLSALRKNALVLPDVRSVEKKDARDLLSEPALKRLQKSEDAAIAEPGLRDLDFRPDLYWQGWLLEVKNVTQIEGDWIQFPDAVSERGSRHLDSLGALADQGFACAVVFALSRPEGGGFRPASDIDAKFAQSLQRSAEMGLKILPVRFRYGLAGVHFAGPVDYDLKS
ncbi:MAG: hypothetical protein CMF59_16075 [Leptospiraceae bacterium]|nr:hypothetical protein [Leptospiraceae bacterium]